MSRTIFLYAGILLVAMGASWMRFTDDSGEPKEGIVLVEAKAAELEKIFYDAADLDVTFEMRNDAFGRHGFATVVENKKKKVDGEETVEVKTTAFKAGSASDKLVEGFSPLMAVRSLDGVDDTKLESFGLTAPEITLTITAAGRTRTLELGGETYGTKDRYVRDRDSGKIYVVDDEPFKTLKFAATRLPERALLASKEEEMESITLGEKAASVEWTQKNKDDRAAAYWERAGATGKDETFANWLEKALKIKSTGYVQEGDEPADAVPMFDVIIKATGKPAETLKFIQSGDDWFARSDSTRGLVKLTRGPTKDVADEVTDILEGKTPPPDDPPAPKKPPGGPPSMGGPPGHAPMMPPR